MLRSNINRDELQKRIAVCTGSASFTQLLQLLLIDWGFTICQADDPSVLLLIENGSGSLRQGQEAVWIGSSPGDGQAEVGMPIEMESLWQILEKRFHSPPRLHIRKAVDLAATVSIREERHATHLTSLSDMGTRFISDRELVKQERVDIKLSVNGKMLECHGHVIFSMPLRHEETQAFQVGVVFHAQSEEKRDILRGILIREYLEGVRAKMDRPDFCAGLAYFDLDSAVRAVLVADG